MIANDQQWWTVIEVYDQKDQLVHEDSIDGSGPEEAELLVRSAIRKGFRYPTYRKEIRTEYR